MSVCDETQNLNDTDYETFFRYQNFSRPIPRLFSVPNYFETGSKTFFGTNFFRYRFRDFFMYQIFLIPVPLPSKNWRIPRNGNSRDRDVTLWFKPSWQNCSFFNICAKCFRTRKIFPGSNATLLSGFLCLWSGSNVLHSQEYLSTFGLQCTSKVKSKQVWSSLRLWVRSSAVARSSHQSGLL